MLKPFVEPLEARALMSAEIVRSTLETSFTGPTLIAEAEPIDGLVHATGPMTALSNAAHVHTHFTQALAGGGTGHISGQEYEYEGTTHSVDNFSLTTGKGTSHTVTHAQLTSESGETLKEVHIFHYMVLADGETRQFEKRI